LLVSLSLATTSWVYAQQKPSRKPDRSDYVSDASYVVATFEPAFDRHSPEDLAAAANNFIESLDDQLRREAALPFDDPERSQWTNLPRQPNDGGVCLGRLNEAQIQKVCQLMASLFSREGYDKICQIMWGDDQLLNNGRPQPGFGTDEYAVMVFGKPSPIEPWAFQLDGHHLGVNVTVHGDEIFLSPSFVGAQPEEFSIAGQKFRPFAGEVDDAYALIGLLNDRQRDQAVLTNTRGGLRSGPGQDGVVPPAEGVECASFDEGQRDALVKLLGNWVNLLPPKHATARMEELVKEIDQMRFSWNGEIDPRSDMSYAIQGPTLIVEFSCQGRGDRPLDHLHSIYRDPTR
jgi:hypothetical protein